MKMNVFIIMLTLYTILFGNQKEKCQDLLKKYKIEKMVKSNTGWMRVCNNGKIIDYIRNKSINKDSLRYEDIKELCECLIDKNVKNRSVCEYLILRDKR